MIDFMPICSPSSLVTQTPHSLTMTSLMMPTPNSHFRGLKIRLFVMPLYTLSDRKPHSASGAIFSGSHDRCRRCARHFFSDHASASFRASIVERSAVRLSRTAVQRVPVAPAIFTCVVQVGLPQRIVF